MTAGWLVLITKRGILSITTFYVGALYELVMRSLIHS